MKLNEKKSVQRKYVKQSEDFVLEDLGVSNQTQTKLGNLDEKELLYQIRILTPKINGVPNDCYSEIKSIADSEGFIRHDFDERTFGLMRLYAKVMNNTEEDGIVRCVCDFGSNEEYERFQNYSREKIAAICDFLKSELQPDEYKILELRYGFGDEGKPKNCAEIARLLDTTYKEVNRICTHAEKMLMYPSRANSFRIFMQMSN